jgi:hypothetical protein
MNEIKRIDENSVSFCGYIYSKSQTPQKMVSDEEPEFWDLIDSIDDGDALIFESHTYYKE